MGLICSPAQKPSGSPSKPFPGLNLHILGVAHAANTNWTWSPSPRRAEWVVGFPRDRSPHRVLDCPPAPGSCCGNSSLSWSAEAHGAPWGRAAGIREPPRPWPAGKLEQPPTGKKRPRRPAHGGSKMTDRKKAGPLRAGPSQDPGRQNPDVHPDPTRSLSLSFPDLETQRKSTHNHMIAAPMAPPAGMNCAVTTVGRTCPSDGSEITKREAHQGHTSRRRYNLLLLICSALSLPSPGASRRVCALSSCTRRQAALSVLSPCFSSRS